MASSVTSSSGELEAVECLRSSTLTFTGDYSALPDYMSSNRRPSAVGRLPHMSWTTNCMSTRQGPALNYIPLLDHKPTVHPHSSIHIPSSPYSSIQIPLHVLSITRILENPDSNFHMTIRIPEYSDSSIQISLSLDRQQVIVVFTVQIKSRSKTKFILSTLIHPTPFYFFR